MEELREQIDFFENYLNDLLIYHDRKLTLRIGDFFNKISSDIVSFILDLTWNILAIFVFPFTILSTFVGLSYLVTGQGKKFMNTNSFETVLTILLLVIGSIMAYFFYKKFSLLKNKVEKFTFGESEYYQLKTKHNLYIRKLVKELIEYSKESKNTIKFNLEKLISNDNIESEQFNNLIQLYQKYITTLQNSQRVVYDLKNRTQKKNFTLNQYVLLNKYLQSALDFINTETEKFESRKHIFNNKDKDFKTELLPPPKITKNKITTDAIIVENNKNDSIETKTFNNYEKESVIKVASEYYAEIVSRKIDIGIKGEYLALSFERQRIFEEEGESSLSYLEHSSKEVGDGLGYDITSIHNGKKVFIEVKTTTGSFWSNLIFTKNEFNVLKRLGTQYWIYRIYNFDEDNNVGKIVSFRGAKQIESYFKFEPKKYTLKTKNSKKINNK